MAKGVLSVLFDVDTYGEGAAHPLGHAFAINYDLNAGKVLALPDLFKPDSEYLNIISRCCITELRKGGLLLFEEGASPTLENYKYWNIDHDGLLMTFDLYQVTSYPAAPVHVPVWYVYLSDVTDPDGPLGPFQFW